MFSQLVFVILLVLGHYNNSGYSVTLLVALWRKSDQSFYALCPFKQLFYDILFILFIRSLMEMNSTVHHFLAKASD